VNREEIESMVRDRFKPCTFPSEPLALSQWQALEAHFGCQMPAELYEIRVLSARYHILGDHLSAEEMVVSYKAELRANPNWTEDFIPFYAIGNGDYLCIRRSEATRSGVYYVAHDDPDVKRLHACVADYIHDAEWFS
jgi:hypothetical protein